MYKTIKKWSACLLLLVIGYSFFYQHHLHAPERQIQTITYESFGWGTLAKAVTIDFNREEKQWYTNAEFPKNDFQSMDEVPETLLEYEPLDSVDDLHQEIAATNVSSWKKNYTKKNMEDGYQWSVSIVYRDGTTKTIHGSNAKPRKYDELAALLF